MADFDLIQTDAQVQSILNDGQNMQGAGAQTTLTTESVLLKDVNGNYHKILKSSFTEAIRDTLAGLLVNNDKGTTINQIAAIASGDFGSITPANLASVLGVEMTKDAGNSGADGGYCLVGVDRDCIAEIYVVDNSNRGYRKYLVMCRTNRYAALYLLAGTEETGMDSSKIDNYHFQINIPSWTHVYYRIILNESNLSISIANV